MKHRQTPPGHSIRSADAEKEGSDSQLEREEEYNPVIEPDPLLSEVGEANEKIGNPNEARRVVPSKPC